MFSSNFCTTVIFRHNNGLKYLKLYRVKAYQDRKQYFIRVQMLKNVLGLRCAHCGRGAHVGLSVFTIAALWGLKALSAWRNQGYIQIKMTDENIKAQ